MRLESILLSHNVQMPVADVPDRNRYRLHRDNAKQEVPGMKEFRQNKCILQMENLKRKNTRVFRVNLGGGENKKPVGVTGVDTF